MPTVLQFRRGSTTQNDAFTGSAGELSVDTSKDTLRLHDGSTQGGFEITTAAVTQTLTNKTLSSPTFSGTITGSLIPSANVTYDLGSSTAAWNNLYLAGNTIFLGTATISYDESTGFQFLDTNGNTATIALTTDDVTEGTNLYYTTARANTDIDARVTQSFINNLVQSDYETYTDNAISALANSAPAALDTLNELAAALGDDPNFATTVTNSLAGKLDANTDITLTLDGDASGSATFTDMANATLTVALSDTGVTANTYGSAALVPVLTIGEDGRVTNATSVSVAGVSSFTFNTGNNTFTIGTADGGAYSATVSLTTEDVTESTNLYYTVARANNAIDNRVTKSFVDALNVDADTLDGANSDFFLDYTNFSNTPTIPQSGVDFDPVGTDNSTDVTLAGSYDYLTITGQQITLNQIDYSTDISNKPTLYTTANANTDIDARVTKTFIDNLNVDADTLDGNDSSYFTNASNIGSGTLASARLPDLVVGDFSAAAIQTGAEGFTDSDSVLMTAAAVQDKILSYGYSTTTGTVTSVATGGGLTGGTITGSGTISHADTSSQSSVNNSGATVIQDVTLDTYGHVTSLASKTLTAADVGAITGNQTITLSGDLSGSGTTSINAQIEANVVGANELNVTGNGTTSQYLRSDGDGTFTWATPPDTNTTYTAGTGVTLSDTEFSIGQSVGTSSNVQFGSLGVGTSASGTTGEIRATNNITAYYSDERLKDFKGTITNALDKVHALNGYYFTSNETAHEFGYDDKKLQVGVSAQEVENVLPEIVTAAPFDIGQDEDGNEYSISGKNYKTVYYDKLVPLLIEAVKELSKEVQKLKTENTNG